MTVASFTLWSLLRSSAMASVSLNCFTRSPCSWAAASRGPSTVLLNKEKQGANADKKIYHLKSNSTSQAFFTFPLWISLEDRCMGLHLSIVIGISSKITFTLLHQKCSIMIVLYDLLWQRANAQNINFMAANLRYQLSWWNQIVL